MKSPPASLELPAPQLAISARMAPSDWAQLLLLSLIWGGSFFLIAVAVKGLPVLTIVALRVSIAALVLWGVLLVTGRRMPRGRAVWASFAVMGLANNAIPFSLIVFAQTQIPSGLASILNATTPLWTVLVSAIFLSDEPPSAAKLGGVVLGLGGVAVMMGLDSLAGHGMALLPQMAMLGAAVSYALSGAYGRRFSRMGIDPMASATGMLTASSVMLIPMALATGGIPGPEVALHVWAAVATLGIICTGFAYVLFFGILGRAGATNISLVTFLVPVSAIMLGWLFLGEKLSFAHGIGIAMIAGGLALIDGRLAARRRG
ncbi:DMT family transporter [Paracoccus sp. DMF-8]|uniref:DMT family transporter n=1 Tax=Paracoccus sp. DMF-8 TaxID=3019445 RepID=UPI0023E840C0|nr:DMT family transporter [Paracoccus sp. DMF-8]MDF3606054.1 DMT family transporter [Paracoccus sp. DMF-8]